MAARVILKSDPPVAFLAQIQWAWYDEGDWRIDTKRLQTEQGSRFPFACFSPLASIPRVSVRAPVPHPLWCLQVSSSLLDFQRAESRKGPFGGFHTIHSGCIVSSLERIMHIATQTHYFCHRIKHGYQVKNRTECISNFSIRK